MLAMPASRFEAATFQTTRKLSRCDVFQNVCIPHVDVVDPLMQRRGIKVSLEHFDIRQLRHRVYMTCSIYFPNRPTDNCLRRIIVEAESTMSCTEIDDFLRLLNVSPSGAVFNPWWEVDEQNDVGHNAPAIRRNQLRAYLEERLGKSKVAIIGEALGYRGGHFSGIPMTSERILLGKKKGSGIELEHVFSSIKPRRTSKPKNCPDGFSEPTATIVWSTLLKLGLKPQQFVLWNAFPWHSFDPRRGMLSNRMPNKSERSAGLAVLKAFLDLFPCDEIVALGNVAVSQLKEMNVECQGVRHPASGGAKLFREQIGRILQKLRP